MTDSIRSVDRSLLLLEALNDQVVSSVDALHRKTAIPKPTLVRILATLVRAGYVSHVDRRAGYALSERILRLSAGFRFDEVIVDSARPLLDEFTRRHDWQVSLATQDGGEMLFRYDTRRQSPFAPPQRYLNTRARMLASAIGRVFLAYCSDHRREALLACQAPGDLVEFVLPEYPHVDALLAAVRRRGYATARRGQDDPVRSFAVPILSPATDHAIGALVLFYYRAVFTEQEAIDRYIGEMRAIAHRIGASDQPP